MSEFVKQKGFQLVLNRVVMRNLSGEKQNLFPGRRSRDGDAKSDAKCGSKSDVKSDAKNDAKSGTKRG